MGLTLYRNCLNIAIAIFLFGSFLLSCSSIPSESEARQIIEQQIKNESEGRMKLISFRKTNAQQQEIAGVKLYQLEYEAEIEFQEDCKWLTEMLFDMTHRTFRTAPTQKQTETKGGYWAGFLSQATQPGKEYKKGQRVKFPSSLTFENTEKGWRPVRE